MAQTRHFLPQASMSSCLLAYPCYYQLCSVPATKTEQVLPENHIKNPKYKLVQKIADQACATTCESLRLDGQLSAGGVNNLFIRIEFCYGYRHAVVS